MSGDPRLKDVVVIGASAGGFEAMRILLAALPADLPAAVGIVLHRSPTFESHLVKLLGSRSRLPVREPRAGERFERGVAYLSPRDLHMTLRDGTIHLDRGPRENFTRPAVDPLFRSAAAAYGSRVIGVILTGWGEDGVSGCIAIKRAHGFTIVQDPGQAVAPLMPRNAIRQDDVDLIARLEDIGPRISQLVDGHARAA